MLNTAKAYTPHSLHFILAGVFSAKSPHYSLSAIRGEYLSGDFNQHDNIDCFVEWKIELSKWRAKQQLPRW